MIKFFVKHPITTIMFVLFFVVLGVVAYPKMNVERNPSVEFPMVTASFVYPGASPDEVESQVIKKTEDVISEVSGVKKITAQAFENGGYVMAEFNLGVNVNDKASEVKAKLESISGDFPDDVKKPVVEKLNPLQESVMDIVLSGADIRDMQQYADDVLSNKITAVSGVSSIEVYGGEKRAVRIYLDPELMASHGMSINDVVGAVATHNLNVPSGKLEFGDNSNIVRFVGEFKSVNDIANLQLTTSEGAMFKLNDVARVEDSALDKDTGARYNSKSVVILSVVKASDGNAIKISKELRKKLPDMQISMQDYFAKKSVTTDNQSVKPEMKIISDSSIAVQHEINGTIRDIVLGLVLTVITLLAFTRNWRTTVIAGIMIPASMVAGLFFMQANGFSINAMTLLAIATALGTLITDAIVMIESALGLLDKGYTPEDAAVEGTKKVMVRVFATIATHVAVFLPIAFMGGIAGQFMKQFGLTVVYLVLLSSLFSFTLTPMMISKILRKTRDRKQSKKEIVKQEKKELAWFKPIYDWQVRKPWSAIGIAFGVLLLTLIPMRFVGNEFTSNNDVNEIAVYARAGSSATYERLETVSAQIEEKLKGNRDIEFVSIKIGDKKITGKIGLKELSDRSKSDKEIAREILPILSQIPGTEIQVRAGAGMSASSTSDMVLNINGDDNETREAYAKQVLDILNKIPEIQSAVLASQAPGQELKFVPNDENMKLWGVKNQAAGTALRTALYGNDTYKYKENGTEYPIVLELAPEYKNNEMFNSVFVGTTNKGLVPLSELGSIKTDVASPDIRRLNKNRITEIDINLGKSTMGPVQKKIEAELAKINWKTGYSASFGGMSEMQAESTSEIGNAFLLAVILTFMVLAAIMNSLAHPFTIVTSILTSFAGVFVLMFLVGANINIAAMLSLVMLVGLAVSTNILLLEPTLEEMDKGVPAEKALWEQFVDKKRMLLMTTIAVVAGLIPQLWATDGVKVSMGAVIIGGILASLFWTFFLTPALFTLMEKFRHGKKNKSNSI